MESRSIIIAVLIAIIIILVAGIGFVLINGGLGNEEKILKTGDLELNMTGYNYKLLSNSSTSVSGVSGYSEVYSVDGNGDSFTLTIMVVDDVIGAGTLGETSTSLSGALNAVAVNRYINGKYYWIQITGGNTEHNTEAYLESIILTQGTDVANATIGTTTVSASTTSSSSSSSSSSGVVCTEHDTNGDGYCTKCGRYTRTTYCDEHDTNGDGYCTKCGRYVY